MSLKPVVVAIVAAALYYALYILPAPIFPVHASGAVVVTGASSGIGLHAAIFLASKVRPQLTASSALLLSATCSDISAWPRSMCSVSLLRPHIDLGLPLAGLHCLCHRPQGG